MWGLQMLCEELVGLRIRNGSLSNDATHDSLEDCLAARELVLWCLRHPAELNSWGKKKKVETKAER